MRKISFLILLFVGCMVHTHAQVGINTTSPLASLHVEAEKTDGTTPEGIIAPKLTRAQLTSKDAQYTVAHNGTFVYVTTIDGTPSAKTTNVTTIGYYYFDGSLNIWKHFNDKIQTADNSLNVSSQAHVQLGGDLVKNTDINSQGYNLTLSGSGKMGVGTTAPSSSFDVKGSFATNTRYVSGNTTLTDNDHTIIYNGSSTATITLPIGAMTGRQYVIINPTNYTLIVECAAPGYRITNETSIEVATEYTVTLVRNSNTTGNIWERTNLNRNEYEVPPSLEQSWVSVNSDVNRYVNSKKLIANDRERNNGTPPIGSLTNYGSPIYNSELYLSVPTKYHQSNRIYIQWTLWGHILTDPTYSSVIGQFRYNAVIYKWNTATSNYDFFNFIYSIDLSDFNNLVYDITHFTAVPAIILNNYDSGDYKIVLTYVLRGLKNFPSNPTDVDLAFYGCVGKGDVFTERSF